MARCSNVGCIPSKALLDSSEFYYQAKHDFAKHGLKVDKIDIDLPTMMKRKDGVVQSNTQGVAYLFQEKQGHPRQRHRPRSPRLARWW